MTKVQLQEEFKTIDMGLDKKQEIKEIVQESPKALEDKISKKNKRTRRKKREELSMEEKTYKIMNATGAMNLVLGIISIVVGVSTGVLLLIGGAKLITGKSKIMF